MHTGYASQVYRLPPLFPLSFPIQLRKRADLGPSSSILQMDERVPLHRTALTPLPPVVAPLSCIYTLTNITGLSSPSHIHIYRERAEERIEEPPESLGTWFFLHAILNDGPQRRDESRLGRCVRLRGARAHGTVASFSFFAFPPAA